VAIVTARPVDDEARPHAGAGPDAETRLRAALREAMRNRDVVAAFALRSALSAIGNAAGQCEHAGYPDRAERLRREARILLDALGEQA
jgi:hypothetical protein